MTLVRFIWALPKRVRNRVLLIALYRGKRYS
jgi:hypothetical protein